MPEIERVSNLLPRREQPTPSSVEYAFEERESKNENEESALSERRNGGVDPLPTAAPYDPLAAYAATDPRVVVFKKVENILSDGLMQLYLSLPAERRKAFKEKGEAIARTITEMVVHGKAKVKTVWHLIKEWLGNLPGINKYYIEQEIKIKTDRVFLLAAEMQRSM
jgi:hypothetical protein